MKKTIILLLFATSVFAANSQQLEFDWVAQVGGPNWDIVTDLTELPDEQLIMVGTFYDSIAFQGESLISKGSRDVFVASFNKGGSLNKMFSIGGTGYEYVKKVKALDDGGIVLPIKFYKEIEIEDIKYEGKMSTNFFIAHYDKSFNLVNYQIIGSSKEFDITTLEVGEDNEVYFSGWFTDSLQISDKKFVTTQGKDIFFGSISKNGKLKYAKHFGGKGYENVCAFSPTSNGNNYLAGITASGCFGEENSPTSTEDNINLFVATTNTIGSIKNVEYPIVGTDFNLADMVTSDSTIWLLGNFKNTLYLSDSTELNSQGRNDVFLLEYCQVTSKITAYQFEGTGKAKALKIIQSSENIFITGEFSRTLYFEDSKIESSKKGTDIFVACLNKADSTVQLYTFPGVNSDFPCSLLEADNGFYLTGEFRGTIQMGEEIASKGKEDIFLAAIIRCNACDSLNVEVISVDGGWKLVATDGYIEYIWDGNSTESNSYDVNQYGTYSLEVIDSLGCSCSKDITIAQTKNSKFSIDTQKEDDILTEQDFTIYPTVTQDYIYWNPSSTWVSKEATIAVYDLIGRKVLSRTITELEQTQYSINFSSFSEGTYIVKINGTGFYVNTKVLVKK